MFQHRIEDRQQLPHAGGERDFLGFAGVVQSLIEDPGQEWCQEPFRIIRPAARRDSRLRRGPVGVERMTGAVDVDDQRCVI